MSFLDDFLFPFPHSPVFGMKEEKGKKIHRIERTYGTFVRSFTVPDDADETNVMAEFKDGVLKVHLPKNEKAKPQTIDVKIS